MSEKATILVANLRGSGKEQGLREREMPAERMRLARRYAFRSFREIARRLADADERVLLLDLDGTLVRLRRRPEDVRVSRKVKDLLRRLARLPGMTVAIVSGRNARSLQELIDVDSVRYFGLHGSEEPRRGASVNREARRALRSAKRMARIHLADFSGVDIEDKGLGFTVHYRGADSTSIEGAGRALTAILAPLRYALHVLDGKKVWEVLPREIPGKGSAMKRLLASTHPATALLYIGDDAPDEPAFAVLEDHITVHVGKNEQTHARFYLRNPGEVLRFLSMLEKELR